MSPRYDDAVVIVNAEATMPEFANVPPDGPEEGLIEARVLLAACGEDRGILDTIVRALQARLPGQIAAVERAFVQGDVRQLRETAHELSGLVSAFSSVMGGLSSELEEAAARGSMEVSALVEKLSALAPALAREAGEVSVDGLKSSAAKAG